MGLIDFVFLLSHSENVCNEISLLKPISDSAAVNTLLKSAVHSTKNINTVFNAAVYMAFLLFLIYVIFPFPADKADKHLTTSPTVVNYVYYTI